MFKKLSLLLMLALVVMSLGATVAQDSELSGELNVYPQNYYNPEADPDTAAVTEAMAQAYMDMHPGVTINLIPNLPAGTDYPTWLAARIAAEEAPDIAWDQYAQRNNNGSDWWVPHWMNSWKCPTPTLKKVCQAANVGWILYLISSLTRLVPQMDTGIKCRWTGLKLPFTTMLICLQ